MIERITPEDKKRRATEEIICLGDSGDEQGSKNTADTTRKPIKCKEENQQPCGSNTDSNAPSSSVANVKASTPQKSPLKAAASSDNINERSKGRVSQDVMIIDDESGRETDPMDTILDKDFVERSVMMETGTRTPKKASPSTPSRTAKRKAPSSSKKRPSKIKSRRKDGTGKKGNRKAQNESPKKTLKEAETTKSKLVQIRPLLAMTEEPKEQRRLTFGEPSKSSSPNRPEPSTGLARSSCKTEEDIPLEQVAERVCKYLKNVQTELSPVATLPSTAQVQSKEEEADARGGDGFAVGEEEDENSNDEKVASSPYYSIFFMKILRRVFYRRSSGSSPYPPSFWGDDLRLVQKFVSVSEKAKQLFVKIFIRKRRWLLAEQLSYPQIAPNLVPLFVELHKADLVESCSSGLNGLTEAIKLLHAPSLKEVAKKYRINVNAGKLDITRELMKLSQQKNVLGMRNEKRMLQVVKQHLGACYRVTETAWRLFNAVFTLYSPSDMSTSVLLDQPSVNLASQLLYILLQMATNKVRYPAPAAPPLIGIYTEKEMLFRYVKAKELESDMADAMGRGRWEEVHNGAMKARETFIRDAPDLMASYKDLPPHVRRFTDLWVLTRCISIGTEALQRLRKYEEAVDWLRYLLNNEDAKLFSMDSRGGWWDRLALNLHSHLKRKDEALEAINLALQDDNLADKQRLLLQDRGMKIDSSWRGPLDVSDPERVDITGSILSKNLGDSRTNRFIIKRNGTAYECPVEEVALDYFIRHGFKEGTHSEGTIWHTIFGLLCYDALFDHSVDNVWFSETRPNPADLNFRGLYTNRAESFDERFALIESSSHDDLMDIIKPVYDSHYGVTNSEISWEVFADFTQIKRFVRCCKPQLLTAVFRRIVTDYRNCRSGFPDLTVWNDQTSQIAVIEVKGPGDKLSTKQRLWLHYFQEHGVTAQVCHVAARNSRRIDDD